MPLDPVTGAQLITFELEDLVSEQWVPAKITAKRNTVSKITSFHDIRDRAREVADRNKIHSVYAKLKRDSILVPLPRTTKGARVDVWAGDSPPQPVGGYAKYDVVDRPGRTGLTQFQGYDPITFNVPIRFENVVGGRGVDIEADIRDFERMGGRGLKENGIGRPGRVRISTTDNYGNSVPLISRNYQAHPQNPNPPLWVVTDIDWDDSVPDGVLRNSSGNRIRQLATVTVQQLVSSGPQGRFNVTASFKGRVRPFQPSWYYGAHGGL